MNQHLLENIVLLGMLTAEPDRPRSSSVDDGGSVMAASDQDWPLKHENKIVQCLAFLSASTEDPDKVSAICLESCPPRFDACVVRVAMNTGVTNEYMVGLERLAHALEDCHREPLVVEDSRLLRVALSVNRKRILARLRSKHASSRKSAGRPPMVLRLQDMTKALSKLNMSDRSLAPLTPIVGDLGAKFSQLEAMASRSVAAGDADELLLSLLYRLDDLPPLTAAAAALTSHQSDFSHPESLLMAITKLRNYRAACHALTAAAQKYKMFEKVTVADVGFNIVKPLKVKIAQVENNAFNEVILRLALSWETTTPKRIGMTLPKASAQYKLGLQKWAPKVHAEIQLLFHYEANPQLAPPRVICSSKAACYLCELFIRLHGRYLTSKTHGVLWPQWTLPNFQSINLVGARALTMHKVVADFKSQLERKIKVQWAQSKAKRIHPGESFTSLVRWTPSQLSFAQIPYPTIDSQVAGQAANNKNLDQAVGSSQAPDNLAGKINICQQTANSCSSIHDRMQNDSVKNVSKTSLSTEGCVGYASMDKAETSYSHRAISPQDLPFPARQYLREPVLIPAPTFSEPESTSVSRSSNDLDGKLQRGAIPSIRDHGSRLHDASAETEMSDLVRSTADASISALAIRKFNFHDEKISIYMELPITTNVMIIRHQEPKSHHLGFVVDVGMLQPGSSIDIDATVVEYQPMIVVTKDSRKNGKLWYEIKWDKQDCS